MPHTHTLLRHRNPLARESDRMAGAPQQQHRRRWAEEDGAISTFLRRQVGAPATWSDVAVPCAEASAAWVRPCLPGPLRKSLEEDERRFVRRDWAASKEEETVTSCASRAMPSPPWTDPFRALDSCAPRVQPKTETSNPSETAAELVPSSLPQTRPTTRGASAAGTETAVRAGRRLRGPRKKFTPARRRSAVPAPSLPPLASAAASGAVLPQIEAAFLKMRADIVSALSTSAAAGEEVRTKQVEQQPPVVGAPRVGDEGEVRALMEEMRRELQTLSQLPEQVARECKTHVLQAMQQRPILLRGGPMQTVTVHPNSLLALQTPVEGRACAGGAA